MSKGTACRGSVCRSCSGGEGPSGGSGLERESPGSRLMEGSVELGLRRQKMSDAEELKVCCPPESEGTGPEDAEGGGRLWPQG